MVIETMGNTVEAPRGVTRPTFRQGVPVLVHHVVARQGNRGLEVLCIPLEGKGETLPVFTAGWAAHGYLFAGVAPGGGWYVRACLVSSSPFLLGSTPVLIGWRSTLGRVTSGARRQT